jgi:hypothetical protein
MYTSDQCGWAECIALAKHAEFLNVQRTQEHTAIETIEGSIKQNLL